MALFRDDQGKTEQATPQKLSEARDKGQAPISREFTMAGSLLVAVVVLENLGYWLIDAFESLLRSGMALRHRPLDGGETGEVMEHFGNVLATVAPPFLFLLTVFVAATALFGYGQIGLKFAKKALGFKPERLNPVNNAKKLFSFSSIVRTALSALKLVVLGSVLYLVLRSKWGVLAMMHDIDDLAVSLRLIVDMAFTVFFWIAFVVLVMSIADIAWQRYDYKENLKMAKHEVEDEQKRSEGDPLIKSRLKSARTELMKQRMMDAMPHADVVITNPTHYSVAIRYQRGHNSAPEVIAKGVDELALKIREVAREHEVPLMEDPPLARALFRSVKVGQEIPEKFYRAVAAVLSHVYRISGKVA